MKKLHESDGLCLKVAEHIFDVATKARFIVFDVGANEGLFALRIHDQWANQKTVDSLF